MATPDPVLCSAAGAWNASCSGANSENLPQRNLRTLSIDFSEAGESDIRSRTVRIAELEQKGESGAQELVAELEDDSAAVRCRAARALGRMGTSGVAALSMVVRSRRGRARRAAAAALGHLGQAAEESAAEVVLELSDPDPDVRRQAAETLGSFGMAASRHAEVLSQHLADGDSWVRSSAARALQGMGPAGARALSGLLTHSDAAVWRTAAQALECMGELGHGHGDGRASHSPRASPSLQCRSGGACSTKTADIELPAKHALPRTATTVVADAKADTNANVDVDNINKRPPGIACLDARKNVDTDTDAETIRHSYVQNVDTDPDADNIGPAALEIEACLDTHKQKCVDANADDIKPAAIPGLDTHKSVCIPAGICICRTPDLVGMLTGDDAPQTPVAEADIGNDSSIRPTALLDRHTCMCIPAQL